MEPHKLLGFDITPHPESRTILTLHAHDPQGPEIYRTVLDIDPYVAQALRLAVLREIPHRPLDTVTPDTLKARLAALADLALTLRQ